MAESTTFVAFDQHAATTVAAVLLPGQRTPALHPMTSVWASCAGSCAGWRPPAALRCCYEAGPCGVRAATRARRRDGVPCDVIAPALIPRRPAIGSRRTGGTRRSWPCCIERAR